MDALAFRVWQYGLALRLEIDQLASSEEGQTLAEYSLILTIIAVGVVVPTMLLFRGALAGAFDSATACISRVTC